GADSDCQIVCATGVRRRADCRAESPGSRRYLETQMVLQLGGPTSSSRLELKLFDSLSWGAPRSVGRSEARLPRRSASNAAQHPLRASARAHTFEVLRRCQHLWNHQMSE